MKHLVIVGNARSYHAIDWYRTIRRLMPNSRVSFASDLVESEGHTKLIDSSDDFINLFNIDALLFRGQSRAGDIWRNAIKMLAVPIQVWKMRMLRRQCPDAVVHAHSMYYMLICLLARSIYIGTPLGSEVLVRPRRSSLYRYIAIRALRGARLLTVDSEIMRARILELCGRHAHVVQNGVDVGSLVDFAAKGANRNRIVSIRALTPLYRIHRILESRNSLGPHAPGISLLYPFWDDSYRPQVESLLRVDDQDLGRLDKAEMFSVLGQALLVISIPESDSSPRSVYEAIFCGAIVAACASPWIGSLPSCMRDRIVIVEPGDPRWFEYALQEARARSHVQFIPSKEAIEAFDQYRSMRRVIRDIYGVVV